MGRVFMDQSHGGPTMAFLIGIAAFLYFYDDGWVNSLLYSFKYGVGFSDVYTYSKPSDCNFMLSPVGSKGCYYASRVRLLNAEGVEVTGENPPIYGSDPGTGKPLISYDNGKVWQFNEGAPDLKPHSVRVSWVRVKS
jgi:hypothetical protein